MTLEQMTLPKAPKTSMNKLQRTNKHFFTASQIFHTSSQLLFLDSLLEGHNHLRDALFDTAVAAGLGPTKEGRFLLPDDGRRPADVLVPNWAGGRDAAMDVTVVNPLQGATIAQAATTPGYALSFAFDRKARGRGLYSSLYQYIHTDKILQF